MSDVTPIFKIDHKAVQAGGSEAGQYLQAIGVFDMSKLNAAQWDTFCWKLIMGAHQAAFAAFVDSYNSNSERPPF